jgi:hypothetical protein
MPEAMVEDETVSEEETQEGLPAAGHGERLPMRIRLHRPLPLGARVAVFLVGWLLVIVGIAGLVLPGIQGIFTIAAGVALLSLDNDLMYRALRRVLRRWPKVWGRVEHFRGKAHDRIDRMFHRPK